MGRPEKWVFSFIMDSRNQIQVARLSEQALSSAELSGPWNPNVMWPGKHSSSFPQGHTVLNRNIYIRMISEGYISDDFEGINKMCLFRKRNSISKM